MGLSEGRRKQRLVGSATTKNPNAVWASNASLPGQRILASMGWTGAGTGLGARGNEGQAQHIAVQFKMDNKGIGARRFEVERRREGGDAWTAGQDLGDLFSRLNKAQEAAQAVAETSTPASSSGSESESSRSDPEQTKKRKRELLDSSLATSKCSKKDKKGKGRAEDQTAPSESSSSKSAARAARRAEKKAKRERRKAKKEAKAAKAAAKLGKKGKRKGAASTTESSSSSSDEDEEPQIVAAGGVVADAATAQAIQALPAPQKIALQGRLAHRAKFLRAKRMVGATDMLSVHEILGIPQSASASPAPSGASTPVALPEAVDEAVFKQAANVEEAKQDKDRKKRKREEKKAKQDADKTTSESKQRKKDKKSSSSKTPLVPVTLPSAESPSVLKEPQPHSMQTVSPLSVQAYLSQRLMVRKAAILRARKAKDDEEEKRRWERVQLAAV